MVAKNQTQPKHLGIDQGHLAELPSSPNAVSSQTSIDDKRVDPLPFIGEKEESMAAIKYILADYDNAEIKDEKNDYLHVVFTSPTLKFKDDVEFYFDEQHQRVDYRSSSRVGYSDMGVNQKRYEEIKEAYLKRKPS
ncbi:hypothetical protein CR194_15770 [Salipaludibacillus keqinensis]|uniref:DUF1499 domain-containing protein n=2 Tax=Salipaludibacillus keqinensis TaxID=2045207 RepID=A0A323TB98_9BACI|nr:hypothetical protein CR194_15770 [Salipaludibacillus keqinensis]